jgi:hypothetical protein
MRLQRLTRPRMLGLSAGDRLHTGLSLGSLPRQSVRDQKGLPYRFSSFGEPMTIMAERPAGWGEHRLKYSIAILEVILFHTKRLFSLWRLIVHIQHSAFCTVGMPALSR